MAGRIYETMFALGARINSSFGRAFANAQRQINSTSRQADLANRRFMMLNSTFAKMAGIAGGVVGVGSIAGLGTKGLDEASNLEQYRNTLEVVMKDAKKAGETMQWAAGFANKTPFETSEVVDATVKLTAYGLQAQKILPAIGDMAGVMGKGLDQAVEAVADAQAGELERLKEFGITKQMIIDHGYKVMRGKEIVNNQGQITDQKAFNRVLLSLMDKRFKGGMDRQSKSFKGTMSTITGVFGSSLAQMAGMSADGTVKVGSVFGTVKSKATELGNKMQEMQNNGTFAAWGDKASQAVKDIGSAIGFAKDMAIVASPVIAALTAAYAAHKGVILVTTAVQYGQNAAMAISNGLLALQCARIEYQTIVAAGGSRTLGIITAAQWLWNAAMTANPIGAVVIGIAALSAGIVVLVKNWDRVTAAAKRAWDWLTKWRKGGGDKAGAVNTGSLMQAGKNAQGTAYWRGGLTWVGEKGPELVNLPRGSQVYSNSKSMEMVSGGGRVAKLDSKLSNVNNNSSFAPVFSPQITIKGDADEGAVKRVMKLSFAEFKSFMKQYENEKRRLQFSPS